MVSSPNRYDKYVLWVLGLVVALQVWFVAQINDMKISNATQGTEVVRMRKDVRNMKAQFDTIIFDLAFKRTQELIKIRSKGDK